MRKRFAHWLWDDAPEWLPDRAILRVLCWFMGHTVEDKLEQPPFCVWCRKVAPSPPMSWPDPPREG